MESPKLLSKPLIFNKFFAPLNFDLSRITTQTRPGWPRRNSPVDARAARPGNERRRQGAQQQVRIGGVPPAPAPAGRSSAEHMADAWVI
ncbi:MAG: hypothetical protein Q7K57_19750 [Burkholderiaceae bacterium]|nr:hypothetical protein [Burkholderiaceae bacterium]